MKYFLSFLGYPRSGHTLVAAIINANPNVYCSNQLNILNTYQIYNSKEELLDYIKIYSQNIGTWKATTQIPHVPKKEIIAIGDKTGHRNTQLLADNPELLDQFKTFIGYPIRFIHVVRNPFDNLTTWTKKAYETRLRNNIVTTYKKELDSLIETYDVLNKTVLKLKKTEDILTIRHEFVITRMHNTLEEISNFLEISFDPQWRTNVRSSIWKKPRITRKQVPWSQEQKAKVDRIISQYEWLSGYDFGGCGRCKKRR